MVDEVLELCTLSSPEATGGDGDDTTAWYDEEASCASAGTAPPAKCKTEAYTMYIITGLIP